MARGRGQAVEAHGEVGAIDEGEPDFMRETDCLAAEAAGGHEAGGGGAAGVHHAVEGADGFGADGDVGRPGFALHEDGGVWIAVFMDDDVHPAIGAGRGEAGIVSLGLEQLGGEQLEAFPLEGEEEIEGE